MKKDVTCIVCPLGCRIRVAYSEDAIHSIKDYQCEKGKDYAVAEVFNPKRSLATTLTVINGELPLVSTKTSEPVPKQRMFDIMDALSDVMVVAPVKIEDVLIEKILGLDIDIVATKNVKKI
jgi:CxxC motif-containing protein